MEKEKILNILSIDGGGIKGIYSLYVLRRIETKYRIDIQKHFKFFSGTSTGGIIALGLAFGYSVQELINFYEENGIKIFPHRGIMRKLHDYKSKLIKSKYDDKELKKALIEKFKTKKIKDIEDKYICIPTIKLKEGTPVVIKTPHSKSYFRDKEFSAVDVALATSAAPVFFPIAKIQNFSNHLIDGGLFANNPTLISVVEALEHFVGKDDDKEYKKMNVLSVGNFTKPKNEIKKRRRSLFCWGEELIDIIMSSQEKNIDNILSFFSTNPIYRINAYLRIENVSIDSIGCKDIKLDSAGAEELKKMKELAVHTVDNLKSEKLEDIFGGLNEKS